MHQDPAYFVVDRAARRADLARAQVANLPPVLPVISKLGRVVQNENRASSCRHPITCCIEVPRLFPLRSLDRYREIGTQLSYSSSPGTRAESVRLDSTTTVRASTETASQVAHL